ncbi:rhodanese-like domain-containing protein [Spiroplasma taiwanense]|uniref:Rhodanese domain-containing protein n=1 Tax=Spiroplasma taiwanense CT-1 TaxID=1276220 RepID=S5MGC5_9MOLU|nr:rhodanese-like domain-containing protein [Spiroplasma taiwanense]AGR40915.1 hypothetical protein STAIW_v1c02510 [Spiroplasma taiwanense CT-1]
MDIQPEEYFEIKEEVFTLDVRTKREFQTLPHFSWATNIEYSDFISNYDYYLEKFNPNNKPIITVCNAGNRSGQTAQFLLDHGYNARTLSGGVYKYYKKIK